MQYLAFLEVLINDGIIAVKKDYANRRDKLEGAIAGFEVCRNKQPKDLKEIYNEITEYVNLEDKENYWWFRCYQAEVEWVCDVLSAFLISQSQPVLFSKFPTNVGIKKAREIIHNNLINNMKKNK